MATPVKFGTEILANTTTIGNQFHSSVTALDDGRFVIAWTDGSQTGADNSGEAVRAQIFNADGSKFGQEFMVNAFTANNQNFASITALVGGRFLATWQDFSGSPLDLSGYGIQAKIFTPEGSVWSGPFGINTTTEGWQMKPSSTALPDGRFAVAWEDYRTDEDGDIRMQIFNPDGNKVGEEINVTFGDMNPAQVGPEVHAMSNGRMLVTWSQEAMVNGVPQADVYGRFYGSVGQPLGDAFAINTETAGLQSDPQVTELADGRILVTWPSFQQQSLSVMKGQFFNLDGSKAGGELTLSDRVVFAHSTDITALPDGRFVIVFSSEDGGITGQLYNGDGTMSGSSFAVDSNGGESFRPRVDALADGRFLVTYTVEGHTIETGQPSGGLAVAAQIFDPREEGIVLSGQIVRDDLVGTLFDDLMDGKGGDDVLAGMSGNDSLKGGAGKDRLVGGAGNDRLDGGDGDDNLNGGAGNDVLVAGTGDNHFDGGAGNDTYVLGSNLAGEIVDSAGIDTISTTQNANLGNIVFIENLALAGASNVNAIGSNVANALTGNAGNNLLDGLLGNDVLAGGAGNDVLLGRGGDDALFGGIGNDRLSAEAGNDRVFGQAGDDVLSGGAGNDALIGDIGNDRLQGDAGSDRLQGDAGNDELLGGGDGDSLSGGLGNDNLVGSTGNDVLQGGDGNDRLEGGAGRDRLTGGAGADVFLFNNAPLVDNRDVIADFFAPQDTFQLENAVFAKLGGPGALNAAFFRVGAASADANDYIVYNKATGVLSYDSNGNLAGGMSYLATLADRPTLAAADFVVI